MIQIPLALTALDYTRPLVWNGTSLEFGQLTFTEIEERITHLRNNRVAVVAMISKIKLDMGKIRRFDFFAIDHNLKLVEKQLVNIIPLMTHLGYSQENMDERIASYNELVELINGLYVKFKDAGAPILDSVKANQAKVVVLQKRVQLMSTAIESMTLQESRMEVRLRNVDARMRGINGQLSKLFASLQVLTTGNYELSGVVAEIVSYEGVVRTKIEKAAADLEELVRRVCEINIAMLEALAEMGFLEARLQALETRAATMKADLVVAEATLNKLQGNMEILRDFYNTAKTKLQSIENYLATFIIGGENVHLDFGDNYTVVHVIPPEMPPCLDPAPCPNPGPPKFTIDDPTIEEGANGEERQLCWTIKLNEAQTEEVSVDYATTGGSAKPMAAKGKILATDEFGNPFIAVVDQPSFGKVVFDGGFPKFYNTYYPSSNAFKYLVNIAQWCGKAGVMKAALICDSPSVHYGLNGKPDDFDKSIPAALSAIGYTVDKFTFQERGNNLDDAALAQYGFIVVISTDTDNGGINHAQGDTPMAMARWVKAGGGLLIVTDHDVFQKTANALSAPYNIEFFNFVDRNPVSIDATIKAHGDHPIWSGLKGQNIPAGGSEGAIRISEAQSDYEMISGTAVFAPGETEKKVCTKIYGNNIPEPDKTIDMTLSKPSKGTIEKEKGVGTIKNDDLGGTAALVSGSSFDSFAVAPLTSDVGALISASNAYVVPDGSRVKAAIEIQLSKPVNHAVSVKYATETGSFLSAFSLARDEEGHSFLAVSGTADTGRAVFDCNVAKFGNENMAENSSSWNLLQNTAKWIANGRNALLLVDSYHDEYNFSFNGKLSSGINNALSAAGFAVEQRTLIDNLSLDTARYGLVIVVCVSPVPALTPSSVHTLAKFVADGGGIFVTGNSAPALASLAAKFSLSYGKVGTVAELYKPNEDHQILSGVDYFQFAEDELRISINQEPSGNQLVAGTVTFDPMETTKTVFVPAVPDSQYTIDFRIYQPVGALVSADFVAITITDTNVELYSNSYSPPVADASDSKVSMFGAIPVAGSIATNSHVYGLDAFCGNVNHTLFNVGNWRFAQSRMERSLGTSGLEPDFKLVNNNSFLVRLAVHFQLSVFSKAAVEFMLTANDKVCTVNGLAVSGNSQFVSVANGVVRVVESDEPLVLDLQFFFAVPANSAVNFLAKAKVEQMNDDVSDVFLSGISYEVQDLDCSRVLIQGQSMLDSSVAYPLPPSEVASVNTIDQLASLPTIKYESTEPTNAELTNSSSVANPATHYTNSLSDSILGAFAVVMGNEAHHKFDADSILYVDCYHDSQSRMESMTEAKNARAALQDHYHINDLRVIEVSGQDDAKFIYDNLLKP